MTLLSEVAKGELFLDEYVFVCVIEGYPGSQKKC